MALGNREGIQGLWCSENAKRRSYGERERMLAAAALSSPTAAPDEPSFHSSLQHNWRRHRPTFAVQCVAKRSPKRLKYRLTSTRKVTEPIFVSVDNAGSNLWKLERVIQLLKEGAVGVIPTDTVYAIVCDLKAPQSIDRIYRIKNMDPRKPLSILCRSFTDIDTYTTGFPRGNSQGHTNIFRAARQCLPGPYTFILPASKEMPKQCIDFGGSAQSCAPRKSVGIRMPNDIICQAILKELDGPLICTSVRRPADDEWLLDPILILDTYGASEGKEGVDFVVDGGVRIADPSTVIDITGTTPVILRRGKGIIEDWMSTEIASTNTSSEFTKKNPYV